MGYNRREQTLCSKEWVLLCGEFDELPQSGTIYTADRVVRCAGSLAEGSQYLFKHWGTDGVAIDSLTATIAGGNTALIKTFDSFSGVGITGIITCPGGKSYFAIDCASGSCAYPGNKGNVPGCSYDQINWTTFLD